MRLPYALQGMIFVPILVGLIFVLKAFCPESVGNTCFADYFAKPIFMPLIVIYKFFGGSSAAVGQEILFILLYWGLVGFLIGFLFDMRGKGEEIKTSPTMEGPLVDPESKIN